MPDLLDHGGVRNAFSIRSSIRGMRERALDERDFQILSGKDIYLYGARLGSADAMQDNWSRIVLYSVSESNETGGSEAAATAILVGMSSIDWRTEAALQPSKAVTSESFVRRAQRLDELGRTDAALDLLYDSIDQELRVGQFAELDSMLAEIRVDEFSADMLLGILTATLPARSRLPARGKFFGDVELSLKRRGDYEEGLLTGLD